MLLADLVLEEQRFATVVALIRSRNALLVEDVFPRFAAAGFVVGGSVAAESVYKAIPIDVVHQLKVYTKGIVDLVDKDVGTLQQKFSELRAHYVGIAPAQKPINVDFSAIAEAQGAQ